MRVAINLLTDDPGKPSGAHWFWKQVISEMVPMLAEDEELHLRRQPADPRGALGLRARRPVHHLPVVQRASRAAHAERTHLRAPAAAPVADRRLQHPHRPDGQAGTGPRRPLQDPPRVHEPRGDQPAGPALPAHRVPPHREGGGCRHHQLREPAPGGRDLPGRRPGEAAPHPRGGRPPGLPAGGRDGGRGPPAARARHRGPVRPLRLLAVGVQELRRPAARVRPRPA